MSRPVRLDLLLSLLEEARSEEAANRANPAISMRQDLLAAHKVVVGPRLAQLAETVRIEDMGVVIRTLSEARMPAGKSWWEWGADIEGRLPPDTLMSTIDVVGMLVDADTSGQVGTMQPVTRHPYLKIDGRPALGVVPVAISFDFREDPDPVPSLLAPATPDDLRREYGRVQNPTPSEQDGCPVVVAALSRRFGIVASQYSQDVTLWDDKHLLERIWNEIGTETNLLVCLHICLPGIPHVIRKVRAERRPRHLPRQKGVSPFDYTIIDLA